MVLIPKPKIAPTSSIILIPWDPESKEHSERLYLQRIACGWRADQIGKWQGKQREGRMNLHWIMLAETYSDREAKLQKHVSKYAQESLPLIDTALSLCGKSRAPPFPALSFVPIGHISLDCDNDDPDLADASRGTYTITTFYVSRAIQGCGIGSAAMDAVEAMATNEPLCAKTLALDTVSKAAHVNPALWEAFEIDQPKTSMEDWYARRGYTVFKYENEKYADKTPRGDIWKVDAVFMRKTVA